MNITDLEDSCEVLLHILKNLRKDGPSRVRTPLAGERKENEVHEAYRKCEQVIAVLNKAYFGKAELDHIGALTNRIKEYRKEAIERIKSSIQLGDKQNKEKLSKDGKPCSEADNIEEPNNGHRQEINATMTENFDFNTAQKLPVFNIKDETKRGEELRDFLNNVEFYHDTLSTASKPILIKFLLKCKIQGKALSELGTTVPATFTDLKKTLLEKCGPKENIETIQAKLNKTQQGNRPMREFVSELEGLVAKMTELEVAAQSEEARPALQAANERRGLAFLKRGVKDRFRLILESARHTTLGEATQHLLEVDSSTVESKPESVAQSM